VCFQTVGAAGANANSETDDAFEDELSFVNDFSFDPEKCVCTSIRSNHSLVHCSGGRGYGMAAHDVSGGCYRWKVGVVGNSYLCYDFQMRSFFVKLCG